MGTENHIRVGKLNMVDLAGSERQSKTNASGERYVCLFFVVYLFFTFQVRAYSLASKGCNFVRIKEYAIL